MHNIKFRGKQKDNNKWAYGYYVEITRGDNDGHYITDGIDYAIEVMGGELLPEFLEVIPKTVGQFTGLLDKNGKEIYAGDVIREVGGRVSIIVFDTMRACFRAEEVGGFSEFIPEHCEIIGNVHDNPELLEQK